MSLHHVAIGAHDVEGVAYFYRYFFDVDEVIRHHDEGGELRSIWLAIGEALLMVEKTTVSKQRVDGVGAGPFLLAFEVDPMARVNLEDRLIAAGYPIEARTEHSSYTRDPEGNRVAMSHYPWPRKA
ncbi:MAG: VOC family protein [Bradymonadaceae bacterium]